MALGRVSGVQSADVSFEAGRAAVVFDPAVTSPDAFIGELERMTGFTAQIEVAVSDSADRGAGEREMRQGSDTGRGTRD